jgi:prepilin-type N-terminal cleavage/methylation domain-containing protein/prepilin-type processing-associated H-X9-DG protein
MKHFDEESRLRGLTLLELLAAIAIVTLLAAILLPAIQRAREVARRLTCCNNLKQIGVALHNYNSQHAMFPSARYATVSGPFGPGSVCEISPLVHLLPFLGQSNLFDAVKLAPFSSPPSPLSDTRIELFLCPSDPFIFPITGNNNYRANLGPGPYWWPQIASGWPEGGQGAFVLFGWLTPTDFTDGMTHTAAFSEKIRGDGRNNAFSMPGDYLISGLFGPPFPMGDDLRAFCASLSSDSIAHDSFGGSSWFRPGFEFTWYNHVTTPNDRNVGDCTVQLPSVPDKRPGGIFAPRSFHPGGVNCLMMDGAVRFIGDHVALHVWKAIGSRAGVEPIDNTTF